jgi:hypothetical protein
MNMKPIGTIKKELAACKAAWKSCPDSKIAWCCHHEVRMEPLTEPWSNRVDYILDNKPVNERTIRLRNFRPVRVELPAELNKAYAEWDKARAELHNKDWPNNTWNKTTNSIFGKTI